MNGMHRHVGLIRPGMLVMRASMKPVGGVIGLIGGGFNVGHTSELHRLDTGGDGNPADQQRTKKSKSDQRRTHGGNMSFRSAFGKGADGEPFFIASSRSLPGGYSSLPSNSASVRASSAESLAPTASWIASA
jgi:hypothetical protein